MLKTFLIKSVVAALLLGTAGAGAAAARETSTRTQEREAQQVQAEVRNELQIRTGEQLQLGADAAVNGTINADCEALQDQDRDQLQDKTRARIHLADPSQDCDALQQQDRLHQSQPDDVQDPGPMHAGSGAGNGHGGRP